MSAAGRSRHRASRQLTGADGAGECRDRRRRARGRPPLLFCRDCRRRFGRHVKHAASSLPVSPPSKARPRFRHSSERHFTTGCLSVEEFGRVSARQPLNMPHGTRDDTRIANMVRGGSCHDTTDARAMIRLALRLMPTTQLISGHVRSAYFAIFADAIYAFDA